MDKNENANLIHIYEVNYSFNKKNNKTNFNESIKGNASFRYDIFDNLKGILIFTVVFAHFLFDYSSTNINSLSRKIVIFIYTFHMQTFVFISGFLTSENSEKISNASKLIILYYSFNFSFSMIQYFYSNIPINFLYPQNSYWYLLSLFIWRISIKIFKKIPFILPISIIITLLEGYWQCFTNVLSIVKILAFFPYFIAGYKIAKMKTLDKFLIWRKGFFKYFLFIIFFIILFYLIMIFIQQNNLSNSAILMDYYSQNNTITKRIFIIIISSIMIVLSFLFIPNIKLPFLSKWGRNSLYIYLFHRIFTIITQKNLFSYTKYSDYIIELSILFTFIILILFGSDFVKNNCNLILNSIHKNLLENNKKGKIISFTLCFSFIFLLLINPLNIYLNQNNKHNENNLVLSNSNIYKENIKDSIYNSIRISYVGDLILLKDQVIVAKNKTTGKYDFDEMFKYTSKHFHESDLSIGIYEGPSAGKNTGFSTSNYDDNIPLALNFPDEFAEAVKKAGINLVTTANNHLLDKHLDGALRTIDILDKYNIINVGSYRNKKEKEKIKIIDVKGIKIAVLAYTALMNYCKMDILYEKFQNLTKIVPYRNNKYYDQIYKEIENDFIKAKNASPDIIMVLVHMGEQFLHRTIEFQDKWNKIFSELGADIILGDHSHTVQPLQYIGNTFVANSPGNFANSYIKMDGDSTAIIDIYINKQTKKVIASSAIPMYTKEIKPRYFVAIPIYDLITNKLVDLNETEKERIKQIQLMSTKVMVGKEIGIQDIQKSYFFINNSYFEFSERKNHFCEKLEKYTSGKIYRYINSSKKITFIGDSITEGTKNGNHPWYEPMIHCFKNKEIINISKGSYTTKLIIKMFGDELSKSKSDLYIIALGTNDIRYNDSSICAMNETDFINQLDRIVDITKNNESKYIFIAPWLSTSDDPVSKLVHKDKNQKMKKYSLALEMYTKNKNFIFINSNEYLEKYILENKKKYMVDYIHPNDKDGIELYCESIFKNEKSNL